MTRQNSAAVSQQSVRNVSYSSETPTFSFSAGVTWFVADLIFSRRAVCPAHSVFSSSISDIISSVVSELLSSFSSENRGFTHTCTQNSFQVQCKWTRPCCNFSFLFFYNANSPRWTRLAHLHPAVCSSGWGSAPLHQALRSDGPWPAALSPSHLQTEPEGEVSSCHLHLTHHIDVKSIFAGCK